MLRIPNTHSQSISARHKLGRERRERIPSLRERESRERRPRQRVLPELGRAADKRIGCRGNSCIPRRPPPRRQTPQTSLGVPTWFDSSSKKCAAVEVFHRRQRSTVHSEVRRPFVSLYLHGRLARDGDQWILLVRTCFFLFFSSNLPVPSTLSTARIVRAAQSLDPSFRCRLDNPSLANYP